MNKQRLIEVLFDMMEILVDVKMESADKFQRLYVLLTEAMDIAGVLEKKA